MSEPLNLPRSELLFVTLGLSEPLAREAAKLAHGRGMNLPRFLVDVIDSYIASQRLEKIVELRDQPVRLPGNAPE